VWLAEGKVTFQEAWVEVESPVIVHIFSRVFYPLAVLQYDYSIMKKGKEK
jgi:hypothetical protein